MTRTDEASGPDPSGPSAPSDSVEGADADVDRSHLDGVEDGCGCTEIWEHLSESRETAAAEADD